MAHFLNNDENEPDLGDEFKSFGRQWSWEKDGFSHNYETKYPSKAYVRQPVYIFYSEEELITSSVFQTQLSMALAHKDEQIVELKNELYRAMWED